ncbi:MAG: B12-binding domain-containing radical SAM protein [Deltaproteobacteria bacterium]|nr:B12-binding domain-containing radical SAM protein [Deltaproteobacteria bacterium]
MLLVTPPLVQLNTPYPATTVLTGFLRTRGYDVVQADPGLTWVLRLLSHAGVARILEALDKTPASVRGLPAVAHVRDHRDQYLRLVEPMLALLQGHDFSLVHRVVARRLLPEGPRFAHLGPEGHEEEYLGWAFGSLGVTDQARYFATLFVEELCDAVRDGIDPEFALARYGETLAMSPPVIDPLLAALAHSERLTAKVLEQVTLELLERHAPDVVGMSVPFPGTVLGALRMAKTIRKARPLVKIVWGGGFVNTELRELTEPLLFEYVDAVTYDDGLTPLVALLEHYAGNRGVEGLVRTRTRVDGEVRWHDDRDVPDVAFADRGTPTYDGLPIHDYLGLIDQLNPMNRLWSDSRWNKLMVAHGCYWQKCAFCDTSLDYIKRYEPQDAERLVDQIEALVRETGSRGFHFVDEAAPPKVLKAMAVELLRRKLDIAWWGNIRFERAFNRELCELLARSGCIAVSGGLEVADERLLTLINKGVSIAQVATSTRAFQDAGIKVHAYLIYGFATETEQETINSLEVVRQLFAAGCLDSAFWHRLSVTAHSPMGKEPQKFGITLAKRRPTTFALNDLEYDDPTPADHDMLGAGLKKAVYNYMHGLGMDSDVRSWFSQPVPEPTVAAEYVSRFLVGP